ncbi:phosphoribosylanthranilate isomerase [Pyrobaculum ferrireducens]|uniref:N-(5'-phosphoribosyl)anthranilate isomerase n=1 Tax=Pyrobaculum ferrireducens TaxID=1104324 RepID=G7VCE1_9CREN|nr:N-(5'-phosphoribosyl)anthranilate isomerase [Pyrobaculum ferrireducens]AET32561.1 phosphoribosyl anthranilate isomerase [Pyrobaculum ferrireducens]
MVLVKICGVTRPEDVYILDQLVDYIGFIVEPISPRSVSIDQLQSLREMVQRNKPVLVTASLSLKKAVEIAATFEIQVIQYHNTILPEDYDYATERGLTLAPVVLYKPGINIKKIVESLLKRRYEYILIDADKKSQERYEGGLKIPLAVLGEVAHLDKVAIAGGITPENAHLVARLRPYMVDVASGVEDAPGVKNMEKVRALLKALGR